MVGPFIVNELIGENAVWLDLPSHCKIQAVSHVCHTKLYVEQPDEISVPVHTPLELVPSITVEEFSVEKILRHRMRVRGFQFLLLMKSYPKHDAIWKSTRDKDEKVTDI